MLSINRWPTFRKAVPVSPFSAKCLPSQFNLQLELWRFDNYGQTRVWLVRWVALLTVMLLLVLLVLLVFLPMGIVDLITVSWEEENINQLQWLFKEHCRALSVHSRLSGWSKNRQILVICPLNCCRSVVLSLYAKMAAKPSGGKCTQFFTFSIQFRTHSWFTGITNRSGPREDC